MYNPERALLNTTYELPLCVGGTGAGWETDEGVNEKAVPGMPPVPPARMVAHEVRSGSIATALA
jgi:hypothetical protein